MEDVVRGAFFLTTMGSGSLVTGVSSDSSINIVASSANSRRPADSKESSSSSKLSMVLIRGSGANFRLASLPWGLRGWVDGGGIQSDFSAAKQQTACNMRSWEDGGGSLLFDASPRLDCLTSQKKMVKDYFKGQRTNMHLAVRFNIFRLRVCDLTELDHRL